MTLTFCLLVELFILVWALRRSGFMLFPHGFMFYLMSAQVFLWLNAAEILRYEFLQLWTSGAYQTHMREMILIFFAFFLASACCVPNRRVSVRNLLADAAARTEGVLVIINAGLLAFLYVRLLLQWYFLDWNVVWENDTYTEMNVAGREVGLSGFVIQSSRMFGVLTVILATYLFTRKNWGMFALAVPLVTWHVLFDLAAHSRAAMVYFICAGLTLMVLRHRGFVAPSVLFACAFVVLLGSLTGRGSGHHGFSSLPFYFTNILTEPMDVGDLTNIFEGIFVTAEYFSQQLTYQDSYKILSLMPTVSLIDGFTAVQKRFEIKLFDPYVPNSAVTEVLSFGAGYALVFFSVQFGAGWLSARALARDQHLPALFVNALIALSCYLQFTYSTRTVFRLLLFSGAMAAVLLFLDWRRKVDANAKPFVFEKPSGRRARLARLGPETAAAPPLEEVAEIPAMPAPRAGREARRSGIALDTILATRHGIPAETGVQARRRARAAEAL